MRFFVEQFKICNFLSFFGEYEINLKPFSAIMCNYDSGKEDFLRALAFVFGAKLINLKIEAPLNLIHKVMQKEFMINREIQVYVEVTVYKVQEKKRLKFRKSLKKGLNNIRFEHKVCDIITSSTTYEENLKALNLDIKSKNLIFYKEYFSDCIWGSSEELEKTIVTCLREDYLLNDWKKAQKEVKLNLAQKNGIFERNCYRIKRMHSVISKFTSNFENILSKKEKLREEMLKKFVENGTEEDILLPTNLPEENGSRNIDVDVTQKFDEIITLESKIFSLEEKLRTLKLEKGKTTANLYYEKIKLAANPTFAGTLENNVDELKTLVQQNENFSSRVTEELNEKNSDLENLTNKISHTLVSLYEIQNNMYLENKFTAYGRFHDYLQPSKYVEILKEIIGSDIFYAHLCDAASDAMDAIEWIKRLKYEKRETFIIFSNYSYQLKDVLTASGEKGIEINSLEQLLIFLTKLMHLGMIDEVPILSQKPFNFDKDLPPVNDYYFYIENNLHFTTNGSITYKTYDNDPCMDTETELRKHLNLLKIEEEVKYQESIDLIQVLNELRNENSFLENDILYFKKNCRNSVRTPTDLEEPPALNEIYKEYNQIFNEFNLEMQTINKEYFQTDNTILSQHQVTVYDEERMLQFAEDLKSIQETKNETEKDVKSFSKKLRLLCAVPSCSYKLQKFLIKFDSIDRSKLFFEKELKDLKKLLTDEDLEDFFGSKEWRTTLIFSLNQDLQLIRTKYKESNENFKTINASRKANIYPLIEHCSHFLSRTCNDLIDSALPYVDLNFSQNEEILQLSSSLAEDRINLVDIKNFNTLLRFISVISLFLEIAKHAHIPVMVFEDLEDYIPTIENFSELFSENLLQQLSHNNKNLLFHFLMRIGQFLKSQINKNVGGNHVRRNENFADSIEGPMQIIYFAKGDFFQAADHYIWIYNKVLPDDLINEDCDSYSRIEEVKCPSLETVQNF